MQVLHFDLKAVDGNYVELRYFVDNPKQYERRSLCLKNLLQNKLMISKPRRQSYANWGYIKLLAEKSMK
ncbi:MAG: hypothetical protein C4323_17240 [Mastigocladus sp. ERB_26_2]